MKKILAVLLTMTMVFALAAFGNCSTAAANDSTTTPIFTSISMPFGDPRSEGETADGLSYKVFSDCVEITGCDKSISSITIPAEIEGKPVTRIGKNAFEWCLYLESINIPDNVTSIGDGAFSVCGSLTSISLPDSVTSIGNWAFFQCEVLKSIILPDSLNSIGDEAFEECYCLTSISFPETVTSIGQGAFASCQSLWYVDIPASVTSIAHAAFANCCSLLGVSIPASVTSIGDEAFDNCDSLIMINYVGTQEQWNKIAGKDEIPSITTIFYNEPRIPFDATCIEEGKELHYFYVYEVDSSFSWNDAEAFCESLGGHLATLTSSAQNDAAYEATKKKPRTICIYFGLSDKTKEGTWKWISGEPNSYSNWQKGEPNGGTNENFGAFYFGIDAGKWVDADFLEHSNRPIICEWDVKE